MRRWAAGLFVVAATAFAGDAATDPADLVKTLVAFADAHPDDLDARVRLGEAYLVVHDVQSAERSFLAVLDKQPNHPGALFGRGCAARDRGWWPDAAKFFKRSVEAEGRRDAARIWTDLVHALTRTGETETLAKTCDRALALSPEQQDGALFAVLAEAARDRGDLKRAMEIVETGTARFPQLAVFAKYARIKKGDVIACADACPEEDQWVEPAAP